ncbi:neutral zinc metallopeptidase [Corynebacterium aquatimens]|uniref:KPN_02809 family neutral zinc metallopeptidase n=1 Tax=Corynebacterium TaxID=1716 RepID=UPI001F4906F5|nr:MULTISPECIES: neutral zinc metallopeptidase [Corynebacterium]QYH19659.1 neutral zinc metallopeptidase [Corynebacterium aquatimens]QYH19667.1 neutral zinc metallopeptidase [Corynebacterium aquatimens]UIZ91340.1 neutral zinc metallopeptidase [Corynebacterium sp. CNCTC7651]
MTFKGNYGQGAGRRAQSSAGSGRAPARMGPGALALPMMLGGGGIGTVLLVLLLLFLFGGFGGGGGQQPAGQNQSQGGYSLDHCDAPNAANEYDDCRAEATVRSVDEVWSHVLPEQAGLQYRQAGMHIFKGDVTTGCGYATSDTGPFYCPRDETAYLDVSFFNQLRQLGGNAGPLAQEYATAHEMGHHIQHIEGTLGLSDYKNPGEDSAAVALELQADCYAGIWAHYAEQQQILEPISDQQLREAIQTARAIGDDNIQRRSGGEVDPDAWTHGSSEQRGEAFMSGYQTGKMAACDTLNRGVYQQ